MLEYFTYKKVKKHQAEKKVHTPAQVRTPTPQGPSPLLNDEDENFLERIVSAEGTPPPLPSRPMGWAPGVGIEAGDSTGNQSQMVVHNGNGTMHENNRNHKGKGRETIDGEKKPGRFASFLAKTGPKKHRNAQAVALPGEASKEEDDINRVLEDLNLAAVNNRAFSLSKESQQLVQQFTVILKDLINGVPTAYDDLTHLLDNSQGTLSKNYDSLPNFLKKLIAQLPDKMTKNLAPELLAVASEAAALGGKGGGGGGGFKSFSLKDLVAKPGAVVSLLKTIMNALKLRWPAFMGTNVLLSLGLFVLLFVFWYCHKRGREVRIERETKLDSQGRIIELDDDPMIGPSGRPGAPRSHTEAELPRPRHLNIESRDRVQSERPHHSRRHSDDVERVERRPTSSRLRSDNGGSGSGSGSSRRREHRRSEEFATAGGERERKRDDRDRR